MSDSEEKAYPKIRPVNVQPFMQEGRPALLIRDPLRLSEGALVIPEMLAPLLALCDGTRSPTALRAALAVRYGLPLGASTLERILAAFDEALLLENERYYQALERTLEAYRSAPYRQAVLAGESYPAAPEDLRRVLDGYLAAVGEDDAPLAHVRGLVSPHIDYPRGGPVYARVWQRAKVAVQQAERVILLGTDHAGGLGRVTLTRQHYATPYGVLPTAREIVDALIVRLGEEAALAEELHHRHEHSLELAAVWLHHLRGGQPVELVPILCGSFAHWLADGQGPGQDTTLEALVETLRGVLDERRTLVVAAADLSHVGPAFGGAPLDLAGRALLRAADDRLLAPMSEGDAEGFWAAIRAEGDRYNVCGISPIYLALRLLAPSHGTCVAYDRCPADEQNTSCVSICGVVFN